MRRRTIHILGLSGDASRLASHGITSGACVCTVQRLRPATMYSGYNVSIVVAAVDEDGRPHTMCAITASKAQLLLLQHISLGGESPAAALPRAC